MSTNTLETAYVNGQVIDASHVNELTQSLLGSVVGRNTSGVATTGQSLGTAALPWGNIYATGLILNGSSVDVSTIVSPANRVVSGKVRSTSNLPQFIAPAGSGNGASFTVEGATTNLVYVVNGTSVTMSSDVVKSSLTTAPSSNNTCLVNDTSMSNDKYAGEDNEGITVDAMGSEITALIGQVAAFKIGTSEIMLAYVKSATRLENVYRGFFMDDSGDPIVRENLSNNDTITLMSLAWVFAEDNGTTVDVTYTTPVYNYSAPSSPSTGDYWYDISNATWKRYNGVSFEVIDRTLIGMAVLDDTDCIAARSIDTYAQFSDLNSINLQRQSAEIIESEDDNNVVNVYGVEISQRFDKLEWNITTDLASGLTEANSTVYYLYITDEGERVIDTEKPHLREDLRGYYHPFNSWRCVGTCYNGGGGDFDGQQVENEREFKEFGNRLYNITVTDSNWTTEAALARFFKFKGVWSIDFRITGTYSSGVTTVSLAFADKFSSTQGNSPIVTYQMGSSTIYTTRSRAIGNSTGMSANVNSSATVFGVFGTAKLATKPTLINYPK